MKPPPQQETDYVNHVFMQQNPGFMILYSFIKDALLSKVGIVKMWWEEREEEERETYYDLTDDQFALLAQAVAESERRDEDRGALPCMSWVRRPKHRRRRAEGKTGRLPRFVFCSSLCILKVAPGKSRRVAGDENECPSPIHHARSCWPTPVGKCCARSRLRGQNRR